MIACWGVVVDVCVLRMKRNAWPLFEKHER